MTDGAGRGSGAVSHETGPRPRSFAALLMLAACAALAFAGFVSLGTWQLLRLQWKLALIDRVEQRVHAAPVPAPGPNRWPHITAETDEYRHVRLTGTFLHELTTLVQATTVLGSGYWVMTPLRGADGNVVLVNRGFIPAEPAGRVRRDLQDGSYGQKSRGETIITGLLRISEPSTGFLRHNDPAANRWYSRDVHAIAAARGLSHVAPYFVDADAGNSGANTPDQPVGGLTVVTFHNNHLVYAITWYALALMVTGAAWWVAREERKARRHARPR